MGCRYKWQHSNYNAGAGKDFSIENVKEPIIAFAFSHKGLMGNITLEGTKITKIKK